MELRATKFVYGNHDTDIPYVQNVMCTKRTEIVDFLTMGWAHYRPLHTQE